MDIQILGYKVRIRNVVSSFNLRENINLFEFHHLFPESIFDKATFNYGVVVLRIQEPKMSFLIYRTGKVISTGSNSIEASKKASDIFLKISKKRGLNFSMLSEDGIQNIVAVFDIQKSLDLFVISQQIEGVVYEPEQFPGAIMSVDLNKAKAKFLVFTSGKIVLVGIKGIKDMEIAIDRFLNKIRRT